MSSVVGGSAEEREGWREVGSVDGVAVGMLRCLVEVGEGRELLSRSSALLPLLLLLLSWLACLLLPLFC